MRRIFGMGVGVAWLFLAFRTGSAGWADGHPDLGFWYWVIAGLLSIAGLGALIGTWIHTQPSDA